MAVGKAIVIRLGKAKNKKLIIPKNSSVVRHRKFLKKIYSAADSESELKAIVKRAKASEISALSEISQNLLNRRYPVKDSRFLSQIRRFKGLIRKLACSNTSYPQKKRLLLHKNVQTGGLPFLVPLLAPLIGQLLLSAVV